MFKIQVNNGAISRFQRMKEVSKLPARTLLREKSGIHLVEGDSAFVKTANLNDSWWGSRIDTKEAIKNAKTYQKDYERTHPETLDAQTTNIMWKRAKELKDQFTIGMLSRSELHPVKGFLDNGAMKYVVDEEQIRSNNSLAREAAWQSKNQSIINEFKNIMRHLNSDDPNAGDIEKYRPKDKKV